jgi:DNA-binding response OmpR family regulator
MLRQAGDLKLDIEHRLLYLGAGDAGPIALTPMETRLLAALMDAAGQVVSRAHLMRTVWNTQFLGDTRTLDVHVCWLRHKLEVDPACPRRIVTHRGRGYELRIDMG